MERPIIPLSEEFSFKAKHHIIDRFGPGKHEHPHRHNYRLIVTIGGVLPTNGMLIDFAHFKNIVEEHIIRKLKNTDLNKRFAQPSVENIAVWIWENLERKFPSRINLKEITLCEKKTSWTTYKGERKAMESIWI